VVVLDRFSHRKEFAVNQRAQASVVLDRCVFYPLERRTLHRWGMRA
jgi:hypothetical protein